MSHAQNISPRDEVTRLRNFIETTTARIAGELDPARRNHLIYLRSDAFAALGSLVLPVNSDLI